MRILDKNVDFYDHYENIYRDNTYTFDRTASFFITKEMVCDKLTSMYSGRYWDIPHIGDLYNSHRKPMNFSSLDECASCPRLNEG